jgi:hypothetical protein
MKILNVLCLVIALTFGLNQAASAQSVQVAQSNLVVYIESENPEDLDVFLTSVEKLVFMIDAGLAPADANDSARIFKMLNAVEKSFEDDVEIVNRRFENSSKTERSKFVRSHNQAINSYWLKRIGQTKARLVEVSPPKG